MKFFLTILILGQILMAAKIEYIEIQNQKIPLIFEQDKRLPLVNMQLVFTHSGTITDTTKAGLAKLSAKMMNQGTKKEGSVGFAQKLEAKAISISAATGTETFVIELSCLKEEFSTALVFLKELLQDPNLTQETLQKVKTMTIGGLSRKENDFDYIASKELKSLLFEGTVLANPSSGDIKSVTSITLKDIQQFLSSHLAKSNLIVLLGGDVILEDITKNILDVFADLPTLKTKPLPSFRVQGEAKERILKKNTQQAYIYFGAPYSMGIDDEEYYKARVSAYILGAGGFGSRLMEEIRVKRGLAYSAYARVNITKSSSYFSGYLQTKLDSMQEAKTTVQEVIKKFTQEGVTQEELEQTKKFLLGSEPLRVETMSQRLNRSFQEFYKGRKLGSTQKELKKIEKLSLKELNKFIYKHTEINTLSYAIVIK